MGATARVGGKLVTQWRCNLCQKYLSSKRSYREHMNIHNAARPFKCEECSNAFASQMTLRRHRLRQHIPRSEWGYPCPYCPEKYMEPASYEQHVSRHHFGQSCTYGCPHHCCTFITKSCKHFLEHVSRHHMVVISSQSNMPPFPDNISPDSSNACYYLIDDEIGSGYGKPPKEAEIHRYNDVLSLTKSKARGNSKVKQTEARTMTRRPIPKVIPVAPRVPIVRKKEEPKEVIEVEYTTIEEPLNEEVMYEEVEEGDEEMAQYYELVDENGISIDNQYYEIDPSTEYTPEYIEEEIDLVEIPDDKFEVSTSVSEPTAMESTPRYPDGQAEFDLD